METINFYSTRAAFGEFSNFARFPIELDGNTWFTTEHYFQAEKFIDEAYRMKIRDTKSAMEAAKLGRSRKMKIKENWDDIRIEVMKKALIAKFTQHEKLKELLLSTGDATLVEHTKNDNFWGDGGDGSGENWLGKLLMELREELK